MPGTKALAFYDKASLTDVKSFITFVQDTALARGIIYDCTTFIVKAAKDIVTFNPNGKESTVNRSLGGSTYPG